MNSFILFCMVSSVCIKICLADFDNLQDVCPAESTSQQTIFINGLPCKNPATITPSDFKSSKLSRRGNTENFCSSSTTIITAFDFAGLNTLGLSIARTDLDVDGVVPPQTHPRATEIFFVGAGVVIIGFVDTQTQFFQKILKEGEVFVVPKGMLHFCANAGNEDATVYSVFNSQNPGLVSIAGAMFDPDPEMIKKLVRKINSLPGTEME
ncbi:hypothetical protein JCGZ_26340 [Jatropha curcas]|uniref:Germin-like protein n=1 Tax=Jatropha curcas TaxID=180498 RepID=A0A067JSJ1_JATCU|nr:germin-like protein subfamily 3 member 4 [Jatropha curcas]KDP22509.1 hypothetical protein JCGZ_26340 [Jatropha curcas]